jgi:hypothetical protein
MTSSMPPSSGKVLKNEKGLLFATEGREHQTVIDFVAYDRFHVVKMAIEAMDVVRRAEMREQPAALAQLSTAERKSLMWGMRKNPIGWSATQLDAMHWLKGSNLKRASVAAEGLKLPLAGSSVRAGAGQMRLSAFHTKRHRARTGL